MNKFDIALAKYKQGTPLIDKKEFDECLLLSEEVLEILNTIDTTTNEYLQLHSTPLKRSVENRIKLLKDTISFRDTQEKLYLELIVSIDQCQVLFDNKEYDKCEVLCNDIISDAKKIHFYHIRDDVLKIDVRANNLKDQIVTARQLEKKEQKEKSGTPVEKGRCFYLEGKKQFYMKKYQEAVYSFTKAVEWYELAIRNKTYDAMKMRFYSELKLARISLEDARLKCENKASSDFPATAPVLNEIYEIPPFEKK